MRPALTTIAEILESSGLSRKETDQLLARFLQEEAFDYVEYIKEEIRSDDSAREGLDLLS